MIPVVVKNCRIGEGRPKIIVPIVGVTRESILAEARTFDTLPLDVVEWRIDWYEDVFDTAAVIETAALLQDILGDIPVLATFRTAAEGGEKAIETPAYVQLMKDLCASGKIDMIDVEYFRGEDVLKEIVAAAHENHVIVVASNHEWTSTPSCEELVRRMKSMRAAGADIPKIAVTPVCTRDVLTLLSATEEMASGCDCPLITMSMKGFGVISRLVGESIGSAMTFGCASKASAPGQIDVKALDAVLETIHNAL